MRRILLITYLLVFITTGFTQNDSIIKYDESRINPLEITKEDLEVYLEDEDFNYVIETNKEDTWLDDIQNWFYSKLMHFFEWLFGVDEAAGYLASFLKIVPYILLGFLIFLIIRFFIKANTRSLMHSKQNPSLVTLSEEERIIKTKDIKQLIKEALSENNYRLAVRYYYLFILKLLSERELIEWQLQKTNDDYIHELSSQALKKPFSRVTLLYDYIWYGEFTIDKEKYSQAEAVFQSLENSIATDA